MAVCDLCDNEMQDERSCVPDAILVNGQLYEPIRWGQETGRFAIYPRTIAGACDSCRAPRGGVHHHGCCIEQCPSCRGQIFGCECDADI